MWTHKEQDNNDLRSILCHPYLFKVSINCIVQDALAVSFIHHYEGINLFQGRQCLTKESFQPRLICLCIHWFIHLFSMHFLNSCYVPGIVLNVEESKPKAQFVFPGAYSLVKGERQANQHLQHSIMWTMKKGDCSGSCEPKKPCVFLPSKKIIFGCRNKHKMVKYITSSYSCNKWVLGQCCLVGSSVGGGVS